MQTPQEPRNRKRHAYSSFRWPFTSPFGGFHSYSVNSYVFAISLYCEGSICQCMYPSLRLCVIFSSLCAWWFCQINGHEQRAKKRRAKGSPITAAESRPSFSDFLGIITTPERREARRGPGAVMGDPFIFLRTLVGPCESNALDHFVEDRLEGLPLRFGTLADDADTLIAS